VKRITAVFLCAVFILVLAGCKTDKHETSSAQKLNSSEIQKTDGKIAENGFDEKFISYIDENLSGNYMVSPLSFRYALGLLLAGAEGETKAELLKALNVEGVDEWTAYCKKFNEFENRFYERLKSDVKRYDEDVENGYVDKQSKAPERALKVANSVWKRENINEDFKSDYKNYICKNFGAEYKTFNKSNLVKKVNEWASEKTEKLIPKLLPDSYDTSDIAVVLMNALYLKNNWINEFEKANTKTDNFKTKSGKTVKKSFMSQTEHFNYYSDADTQMVILPMNSDVNMAFVLGDTSEIKNKISKSSYKNVTVKIPKIDIETSLNNKELIDFLKDNGVKNAFLKDTADFSGMIDRKIWVDDIIQKTKIKTDANGVEAAAVTAILMMDSAYIQEDKPVEFTADRPFSFYIYSNFEETNTVLFAGRVEE